MKRIYRIGLLVLMALGLFIYISRVKKQSPEVKITTESLKNSQSETKNKDFGELKNIHWQFADQFEEAENFPLDSSKKS